MTRGTLRLPLSYLRRRIELRLQLVLVSLRAEKAALDSLSLVQPALANASLQMYTCINLCLKITPFKRLTNS
jgi:hypothetical protein